MMNLPTDSARNIQHAALFTCACGERLAIVAAQDGARNHRCAGCARRWRLVLRAGAIVAAFDPGGLTRDREREIMRAAGGEMARHFTDDPERQDLHRRVWEYSIRHPWITAMIDRVPLRWRVAVGTWFILPRELRRNGVRL